MNSSIIASQGEDSTSGEEIGIVVKLCTERDHNASDYSLNWFSKVSKHMLQLSKSYEINGGPSSLFFDHIYEDTASTLQMYEQSIQKHILSAVKGYNAAFITFGSE